MTALKVEKVGGKVDDRVSGDRGIIYVEVEPRIEVWSVMKFNGRRIKVVQIG